VGGIRASQFPSSHILTPPPHNPQRGQTLALLSRLAHCRAPMVPSPLAHPKVPPTAAVVSGGSPQAGCPWPDGRWCPLLTLWS
jgi:hypothetical protein